LCSSIQIYLLAVPAGLFPHNLFLYRLMLHYLHGPLAAILFPVTECLLLPFEVSTYWIQHVLMLVVPVYLLICQVSMFCVSVSAEKFADIFFVEKALLAQPQSKCFLLLFHIHM
jgi:hypothetical protein